MSIRKKTKKNSKFDIDEDLYYDHKYTNHANCDCCYNGNPYISDDIYDFYDFASEYIEDNLINFHKSKVVKEIFKKNFLDLAIDTNKYKYNDIDNTIFLYPKMNDFSNDYRYLIERFIDSSIYDFEYQLIIKFKDLSFQNVDTVNLRVLNKYKQKKEDILTYKKNREHIDINLIKFKNGFKLYNNDNMESIIKKSHNSRLDPVYLNELCETNCDLIFNYFIEKSCLVDNGEFKITELLKDKSLVKLLNLYVF